MNNIYKNGKDDGRFGRNFEVDFRELIMGYVENQHGGNKADIAVTADLSLECKTGCGWLTKPYAQDKPTVEADMASGAWTMEHADYVAYLPEYDGTNLLDARILTQEAFLDILQRYGKIRVKRSSAGQFGIAIQSYIPTPKFKASPLVYSLIKSALATEGETAEDFVKRVIGC